MRARHPFLLAGQVALFLVAGAVAALVSRSADWQPIALVVILLALAVGSDLLALRAKSLRLSGSFLAIVLAMALLGPAPAAAIGVASILIDALRSRPAPIYLWNNLATYALFPLAGGLAIDWAEARWALEPADAGFLLVLFFAFALANLLNFVLVAWISVTTRGLPLATQFRTVYIPVWPSELATALLAVGIAYVYVHVGMAAIVLLALVLITYQYLLGELLISQQRAEELQDRSKQLASLQVGVLSAMLQTLSLRDRMTARHSAAVARYAREIAAAAGRPEEEQELVHTAGLLHDIGKFIFPDHILLADRRLDDEDWEIVKKHPAQGARVVRKVDGYGPVADIILAHHERIDGRGYPRGIAGEEIPLLARMISVADTYDVMTARDSYRAPVPPEEAIAELRRVAGTQLDAELVEVFVGVLQRKGVGFRHADDADFEAELAFEKRVAAYAEPRALAS